jgi:hypothetical protein
MTNLSPSIYEHFSRKNLGENVSWFDVKSWINFAKRFFAERCIVYIGREIDDIEEREEFECTGIDVEYAIKLCREAISLWNGDSSDIDNYWEDLEP